jgi:hypothetical protein
MNESEKLSDALLAYNKVSKTKLPNVEAFQRMLSVSLKLRAWYEDWSFTNSAFKTMPKSFSDSGISREEWQKVQSILPKVNEIKANSSARIELKAKEFSSFVETENARCNDELQRIQTPLVEILKVNVLCLGFEEQFNIISAPPDKQEELKLEALEKLRCKLLDDLKNGRYVSPFVQGDFNDLVN